MLILILDSILIVLLFTPFGLVLSNENQKNLDYFSTQLLYGLIIISFIALSLNFLLPLNKNLNSFILLLPIILILKRKKIYFSKEFLIFLIASASIISILILESNVYRPDAGLYHLPYIKILNEEKIIFGLSNLHVRYSHISIIQYLSAISNNIIFNENGIIFAQALIASSVIINFSYKIYFYNKNKNYNFHFFYLVSTLIFIIYKMNRYSEYGNDAPTHFLFFFLVSELLNSNKENIKDFCNSVILMSFIIFNKITLLMCLLLGLIALKKINLYEVFKLKRFYFLIIFIVFWFLKNIIISGCVIYPVKSLCFKSLIWSDLQSVEGLSIENEAYTKGWPDYKKIMTKNDEKTISIKEYSKKFFWLPYWSEIHLKKILKIITPYILTLTLILIYLIYPKNSSFNLKKNKTHIFFIFVMFFSSLFWFVKVPVYRYGYSYFISLISLIFAYLSFHSFNYKKNTNKFFNFLLIFCIVVFFSKNILRIIKTDNNYNNYPWPKYFSMTENNLEKGVEMLNLNGKKFYKPIKGEYCMYSKSPCGHYGINDNLRLYNKKSYYILFLEKIIK